MGLNDNRCANTEALNAYMEQQDKQIQAEEAFDYDCNSMLQEDFELLETQYKSLCATHGFDDKTFIEYIQENWQ